MAPEQAELDDFAIYPTSPGLMERLEAHLRHCQSPVLALGSEQFITSPGNPTEQNVVNWTSESLGDYAPQGSAGNTPFISNRDLSESNDDSYFPLAYFPDRSNFRVAPAPSWSVEPQNRVVARRRDNTELPVAPPAGRTRSASVDDTSRRSRRRHTTRSSTMPPTDTPSYSVPQGFPIGHGLPYNPQPDWSSTLFTSDTQGLAVNPDQTTVSSVHPRSFNAFPAGNYTGYPPGYYYSSMNYSGSPNAMAPTWWYDSRHLGQPYSIPHRPVIPPGVKAPPWNSAPSNNARRDSYRQPRWRRLLSFVICCL